MDEHTTPTGYAELVRANANFRYLWFGQIVSLLGDWFNLIASAALVASLTDSGLAVGGLFVVRMLAPFLVSPLAGVAADRYNRQRLLILTDIGRAGVVMGFLLVRDPGHVWLLYTLTAAQLALSGFFFPARNAILPDIVERRALGTANALSSATWSVMLAFGAALGGLAAGSFGVYPSFVLDALTFVGSAVFLARIRYDRTPVTGDTGASVTAILAQYAEGLRYLRDHVDILVIALHKGMSALIISGPVQILQVQLAEEKFVIGKDGGTGLGLMYAVAGVGTGLGPIAMRWITGDRDRRQRLGLAFSYAITAVGMLVIASLSSFEIVLIGTFLRGFGGGIVWVFSTQLLLQTVPDRVRGRVFATEFALSTLLNAIGATMGGAVLQTSTGLSVVLGTLGGLILVPGVLWTLWTFYGPCATCPPDEQPTSAGGHK